MSKLSYDDFDDFKMFLAKEYTSQTKIYGIQKSEYSKYIVNKKNQTLKNNTIKVPWPYSIVKVEIVTSGNISSNHLIVVSSETCQNEQQFKFGRADSCDIIICQNTISRE